MTLEELAAAILDYACPNGGVEEDGWATCIIETHCVEWIVSAKKVDGQWELRKVDSRDC